MIVIKFCSFISFEIQFCKRHGHALEKISDDTFIYFDNDLHNQTDATNLRSRIMEIRLNEETMTANVSWEWIAPSDYFSG